jgi:glucose/arabinose dehydrogenase
MRREPARAFRPLAAGPSIVLLTGLLAASALGPACEGEPPPAGPADAERLGSPPRTPDAFRGIGRVDRSDAGDPGVPDEPGGPDWAPPLKLVFEAVPHDAPLLRATDLGFLPDGSGTFLWLDKDGEVHVMRLFGGRARRLGGYRVADTFTETDAGLLSVAFDPDFARNRFVYLGVTIDRQTNVIRRYRFVAGDGTATLTDPVEVLRVAGPGAREAWHNVGSMGFDEAGVMWALFGDKTLGAPAEDPGSPLGALLRLLPRPGPEGGYDTPADNPFTASGGHPAVYAKGMRSPWKGLYHEGRWFFGDVGQDTAEEINVIDAPGLHFGWPRAEGPCEADCEGLTDPWMWYGRSASHRFVAEDPDAVPAGLRSVWIGAIYRPDAPGAENDPYLGRWRDVLVFGDWATGFVRGRRVGALGVPDDGRDWPVGHLHHATAFAQAPDGSVYATGLGTWPADRETETPSPLLRAVLAEE